MSCHLSHRLTTIHRSVSMALLYSVSCAALMSNAQAATMGKTIITSAQHEPLSASIVVTDIQTPDFSASLADPTLYQQMGLSPTDSMTVRFQPTSATSGHVFITTTKPVSQPFADVVLAINDGAQRSVIPKTLLMPLDGSLPINPSKNSVTAANKLNLPTVSPTNAQPLTVRKGNPPPLLPVSQTPPTQLLASKPVTIETSALSIQLPSSQASASQVSNIQALTATSLSPVRTMTQNNATTSPVNRLNNNTDINKAHINKNATMQTNTTPNPTGALDKNKTAPMSEQIFDILNVKITRQIQLKNNKNNDISNNAVMVTASTTVAPYSNRITAQSNADNNTIMNAPLNRAPSSEVSYSNASTNQIASKPNILTTEPSIKTGFLGLVNTAANNDNNSKITYTVQRNDNLWVIAQQIAEKNNLDVQTVMSEIQAQNPKAFINKNADQLKANAELSLPNYDVMPTQKKLQEAISTQKQYPSQANTPTTKKSAALKPAPKAANEKPVTKKTQILPAAQFSVLAPGYEGSADGTKTKKGVAAGNGLSTDVLDILKSSRQSTADQAQRLSKTNNTLGSYTKKLQLQNQKLAELQARLEKLRNQ
ncbi:peptigoglycan-binding protein LysM [Psychrobacter sp. Sarcosine-02u-2]|uniref:type IV pilus assembly protein FimV n=1 Tax=Psychrobacter sp. Sarcosine-02u-2 TaxID=2058324 RepID=UPI000C7B59F6|nr:peptigoglycan-binding protein LysM [Psychrobacter sp. Sarcosine-02u-2]PKG84624.1 peptigoglycan-binding protein LysM [Psychrobacter sp. Sarcosine-02u-2]